MTLKQVEILSSRVKVMVDEQYIPSIIGRGGSNINEIEKSLKDIDVVPKDYMNHQELLMIYHLHFQNQKLRYF